MNPQRRESPAAGAQVAYEADPSGTLRIRLSGPWLLGGARASAREAELEVGAPSVQRIEFEASQLVGWDSSLLTFLTRVLSASQERHLAVELAGLPPGVGRLIALANATPERTGARGTQRKTPWLARTGETVLAAQVRGASTLHFIGEVTVAFARLVSLRARFQRSEFAGALQQSGPQALPIVSLISFLLGLILAFMGAVQLLRFGAQIYVADLVTLGMLREMGPIMTAIVMAGRTGAAFAAQLGTMKVNQEIDAFATFGIPPIEYLVLPRILALALMLPLLCVYADALGILGGIAVGGSMLHLSLVQYWNETAAALRVSDLALGVSKAGIFGVLIGCAGCLCGTQCGTQRLRRRRRHHASGGRQHRADHRDRRHLRRRLQRPGDLSHGCIPRAVAEARSTRARAGPHDGLRRLRGDAGTSISRSTAQTCSSSWGAAAAARARCSGT